MIDIYESAVDAAGTFCAAFVRSDKSACFYLLDMSKPEGQRIVLSFDPHALSVISAETIFSIRWGLSGTAAGLFIDGTLLAIFDLCAPAPVGRWASPADDLHFLTT